MYLLAQTHSVESVPGVEREPEYSLKPQGRGIVLELADEKVFPTFPGLNLIFEQIRNSNGKAVAIMRFYETDSSIYAARIVPKSQILFFRSEAGTFMIEKDQLLVVEKCPSYQLTTDFYGGVDKVLVISFDERSQNRVSPTTYWFGR